MVPTTVERLREGQGVLERVLRSIKMERNYKRSDGAADKESGMRNLGGSWQIHFQLNCSKYKNKVDTSNHRAVCCALTSFMITLEFIVSPVCRSGSL